MIFESYANIQRQGIRDPPVILHVRGINISAVFEQYRLNVTVSSATGRRDAEPEICQAGTAQGINRKITETTIFAGVIKVLSLANVLKPSLYGLMPTNDRQVVIYLSLRCVEHLK